MNEPTSTTETTPPSSQPNVPATTSESDDPTPKSQLSSPRPERTTFAAPKPTERQLMAARLKGETIKEAKFVRRSGIDVMMSLEGSALHELRRCFEDKQDEQGEGLDQQEFVNELLRLLRPEEEERLNLVSDLIEVFEQIDINGDGTMEWAEFTAFCVEAGLLATHRIKVPLRYNYVENRRFQDTITRGHVKCMGYISEIKQLGVSDGAEPVLRLYDDDMKISGLVDLRVAARILNETISGDGEQTDFMNPDDLKARVNAFCWLPTLELIVCATSDLALSFWEEDPNYKGRYRFQGRTKTDTIINKIYFEDVTQLLFTVGGHEVAKHHNGKGDRSGIITGWRLTFHTLPGSTMQMLGAESQCTLEGQHKDFITDCIGISHLKYLVTSSMDRKKNLVVWDMVEKKAKFTLDGHKRGCKQLAWAQDQRLLLSVGFEYEALAWDIKTSKQPIMKLVGHRAPLLSIVVVKFNPLMRAVTVDMKGNFKMWDIRKSTHNTALCLQSWETHDGQFTPLAMTANQTTREVVAGGYKLRRFECRRKSTATPIPRAVLYNSANLTFAVALENEVQVYDAQTGLLVNTLHEVCDSEVTTMCLDTRQRKLLIGTHRGECLVFSYMTGALMKRFQSHSADVSDIAYCHGDKCVITTSWDRTVQICDEEPMGHGSLKMCPTLRSIENAHNTDVVGIAFDHELSLFATIATDATLSVYDFQFGVVEASDVGGFNTNNIGHTAEITALSFVGGRIPALVTADAAGIICMWAVRPSASRGKLIHRWGNMDYIWDDAPAKEDEDKEGEKKQGDKEGETEEIKEKEGKEGKEGKNADQKKPEPIPVSSFVTEIPMDPKPIATNVNADPYEGACSIDKILIVFADKTERGPMLITADEEGYLGRWDLRPLLNMVEMNKPMPWSKSPTRLASYSAHRRSNRNAANESSTSKGSKEKSNGLSALRKLSLAQRMWGGYQEKIRSGKIGAGKDGLPNHLQLAFAVPRIVRWSAHSASINALSFVDEAPYGLITCSIDMSTRVWSLLGTNIGQLTMSDLDKEKILQGRLKTTPWIFRPDVEYHIEHGERTAVNLMGAMGQRKRDQFVQAEKEERRKETLLENQKSLENDKAKLGMTGASAPTNPLRASLDGIESISIAPEKRDLFNDMLNRVASKTRIKRAPVIEENEDGGDSLQDTLKPETTKQDDIELSSDPRATGELQPALRPYEHYDYEMSKVKTQASAIMDVIVETAPSPFMREFMPKDWKQTTPSERLDKKNREKSDGLAATKKRTRKLMSASAPLLPAVAGASTGDNTNKHFLPLSGAASMAPLHGSVIDSISDTARVRKEKAMRKRMQAKIKAFEQTIDEVSKDELADAKAEKARVSRQPKERVSLYASYDDLSDSDDEGGENLHKAKVYNHRKVTNFGSYNIKEVLELRKLFNSIDEDASGSIDVDEFVNSPALNSTHMFMNATSMFGSIDRDASGTISFGELLAVAFPQASRQHVKDMLKYVKGYESQAHMKEKISLDEDQLEEISNIFAMYDVDDSGGISTEEMYEAMVGANPAMREIFSIEEMDKLVRQYDDDGNATLELEEFTKMFRENFMEDKAQEGGMSHGQSSRGGMRSR